MRAGFDLSIELSGCPLWVISGHIALNFVCLLLVPKQTLIRNADISTQFSN
jgi:hypothetical protein